MAVKEPRANVTGGSCHRNIEDYGIIGNMLTAALVGKDGSIDWLCLPRFDSPACFAALLGTPDNGRWKIAPRDENTLCSRRYLDGTAILETRFETVTGVVTVTDFMPLSAEPGKTNLVRIIAGERGQVDMQMELILRFSYGQAVPWVQRRDYGLSAVAGPDTVHLHTRLALKGEGKTTRSRFTISQGERLSVTLSYHASTLVPSFVPDSQESLQQTTNWWHEWSKRERHPGGPAHWQRALERSLITLKLLTFEPTGAIIAAPTTSLPERIGGQRNWDYRYCWLRDSALTLLALLQAGYRQEAEAWRQWLLRAVAGDPDQLQIMYGIAGERWLPELEVPWLAGFEQSKPVRIGNAAASQMQLDVYGELFDTLHGARVAELQQRNEAWSLQKVLLTTLAQKWQIPDQGIWEVRGPARAFTHSRMMVWVAFDRAITAAEQFHLDGPVDEWKGLRAMIHDDICQNAFDRQKNSFVQYYGGKTLDASLLLMPQTGFLPPDDPRVLGTLEAVENELLKDGLMLRYSADDAQDGMDGGEGAFLVCSFWLADAYVLCGQRDKAAIIFERLLALRNDLGLLSEEYDCVAGRMLGNFPQAFSHIGLINTAHNLLRVDGPARERAQRRG
ncbi:Glucoamylase (glucan-1,4-alpha-glucosidase), GH15 family [Halopseudomonas litoralis]|uniref:Trehalase n=1 Tax=Halopseudomonas litoralis TaxID=797277 RepID=A0A1H1UG09_9GAMM|nr:glycoside hydrolase family 15 protein [Halopseudomonas litoralis]SDS71455.1 Glucoamylase (glucan-1,4-alpha-glucosidase), GH15 family [Halopseudomonas litoralis]